MTQAEKFVEKVLTGHTSRVRSVAKGLGGRLCDSTDGIYQFYLFADGSKAGTKPAKPTAIAAGKSYQAWVVIERKEEKPEKECKGD